MCTFADLLIQHVIDVAAKGPPMKLSLIAARECAQSARVGDVCHSPITTEHFK